MKTTRKQKLETVQKLLKGEPLDREPKVWILIDSDPLPDGYPDQVIPGDTVIHLTPAEALL